MPLPAGPGLDVGPEWLPTADEIRAELHGREEAMKRRHDDELDELVLRRYRSLAAELPTVLPARLESVAHDYLLYSVCSILEDRLFPEQANLPESNAVRLDRRAGAEIVRLRKQIGETDDGATNWSGTIALHHQRTQPGLRPYGGGNFDAYYG